MIIGIAYAVTKQIGKLGVWWIERGLFSFSLSFSMSVFKRVCVSVV